MGRSSSPSGLPRGDFDAILVNSSFCKTLGFLRAFGGRGGTFCLSESLSRSSADQPLGEADGNTKCGDHVGITWPFRLSAARLRGTDQSAHHNSYCAHDVVSPWSWGLVHALLGVALVSSGTAALNEVLEVGVDGRMRRTAGRPLPAGRMSRAHAATVGLALTLGGSAYLAVSANLLTGLLVFLTALVYLAAYTPLKKVSPVCTFVGAFPGAMPVVLGWTAVRGRIEIETLVLFAIMFIWQFPHFLSIAWLYREDYERGEIRMLPVVESNGKSTVWRILAYSVALIPVSILPAAMGMAGRVYVAGAVLLGALLLRVSMGMAMPQLPATAAASKPAARRLLRATILYLPALFALMMVNAGR
jgi:heme o synthase